MYKLDDKEKGIKKRGILHIWKRLKSILQRTRKLLYL